MDEEKLAQARVVLESALNELMHLEGFEELKEATMNALLATEPEEQA